MIAQMVVESDEVVLYVCCMRCSGPFVCEDGSAEERERSALDPNVCYECADDLRTKAAQLRAANRKPMRHVHRRDYFFLSQLVVSA